MNKKILIYGIIGAILIGALAGVLFYTMSNSESGLDFSISSENSKPIEAVKGPSPYLSERKDMQSPQATQKENLLPMPEILYFKTNPPTTRIIIPSPQCGGVYRILRSFNEIDWELALEKNTKDTCILDSLIDLSLTKEYPTLMYKYSYEKDSKIQWSDIAKVKN